MQHYLEPFRHFSAAYIALYNQGVKFFEQPVIVVLGINIGRWYSNCRRSVSWFSNQVFWPACGIRSCTGAICQDWPPQHPSRPEYPPSSIYRIVEWCSRRTRGPTCLSEWRSWALIDSLVKMTFPCLYTVQLLGFGGFWSSGRL